MQKKISEQLLDAYLKGECTPDEERFVKEWYYSFKNDEDNISGLNDTERHLLKERMYLHISDTLVADKGFAVRVQNRATKFTYLKYAALLIAAIYIVYLVLPFRHKKQLPASSSQQFITINNTSKSIREQILADGSIVWLSPGANITYARDFGYINRQLTMSGEAFFEVTKNPLKPFIINSGHIITKVWGTSFRVIDPKDAANAEVAVVTGKVSVSLPNSGNTVNKQMAANTYKTIMLYPTQQAEYSEKDNAIHADPQTDIEELLIWKKTKLAFDNSQIKEVIPLVSREFGLNIRTADKNLDNYFVTADFNGLNFAEVMEVLRNTLNLSYEINGKEVILTKNQEQ
jgi:transmembrane sensor